jgi:hypothetical protein
LHRPAISGKTTKRIPSPVRQPDRHRSAGAVHLSVLDAARYAAFHLAAARGNIERLKPHLRILYAPPAGSDYALGWSVQDRPWADGKNLNHAGSNTLFYMVIGSPSQRPRLGRRHQRRRPHHINIARNATSVVAELIREYTE